MKNRINLSKYNIRTDLIIDHNIEKNNLKKKKINNNINITTIDVNKSLSKELNKEEGKYITIEFTDITNHEDKLEVQNCLTNELKKLLKEQNINEQEEGLIIGLGNKYSTPDSLGPKVIDKILVTRHLFELNTNVKKGIRKVAALSPGVMATTGIDSSDIIISIIKKIKPKFLIIIDALASSSIDRINKTIQLTNTGIHPGSGIGNYRKEISKETMNIPIIALGVPTVVDSSIIVNDTLNYLFKHISYLKTNYNKNKLIINYNKNHKNDIKDLILNDNEKKEISGILGTLNEIDKKSLINEVLKSTNNNMIVTPTEIDFLIENLCDIIATSINKSLHNALNN